jgi:hypothetical protein
VTRAEAVDDHPCHVARPAFVAGRRLGVEAERVPGRVGVDPVCRTVLQQAAPNAFDEPAGGADVADHHVEVQLLRVLRVAPPRRPFVRPTVSVERQMKRSSSALGVLSQSSRITSMPRRAP